jgi:hypothetical protein
METFLKSKPDECGQINHGTSTWQNTKNAIEKKEADEYRLKGRGSTDEMSMFQNITFLSF